MISDYLTRKLIGIDYITGKKKRFAVLSIGNLGESAKTLLCEDETTGEVLMDKLDKTYWHPLNAVGLPIDGIVRIEKDVANWIIKATTSSRVRTQTEFVWLRALAEELHSKGIRYEPLLRQDTTDSRCIIDAIKIPRD